MNLKRFRELPILGILRGIDPDAIEPLAECVIRAGLKTVEITMNTHGAADLIRKMKSCAEGRLDLGAGTVMSAKDMHEALDAGASFIVMPVFIQDVATYCFNNKIPVFPGAFTPQEVYTAWAAGATMVKVFPAKFFGPAYIKELKGPLDKVELLACGGVGPENLADFFNAGASAVAFGSSIFKREWIKKEAFKKIEESIKDLIGSYAGL